MLGLFGKIVFTIVFFILLICLANFLYKRLSFMNNFQKIVLIIAIIILIALLVFIAVSIKNASNSQTWPPVIGDCPDYWIDTSGNGGNCVNIKNLGTCPSNVQGVPLSMDFTGSTYNGSSGMCNKYNFATGCGLTWDGITYGGSSDNPCD